MARIRRPAAREGAESDFSDSNQPGGEARLNLVNRNKSTGTTPPATARRSPRKKATKSYCVDSEADDASNSSQSQSLIPKTAPKRQAVGRQIQLKSMGTLSFTKSTPASLLLPTTSSKLDSDQEMTSPKRRNRHCPPPPQIIHILEDSDASAADVEVEQSIWCGSDADSEESDEELSSLRKLVPRRQSPAKRDVEDTAAGPRVGSPIRISKFPSIPDSDSDVQPLQKPMPNRLIPTTQSRPASSSDKENNGAFIRFSPPRLHTRPALPDSERPVTPPQSPSKSRLQSPSKTRTRIPTPPIRQSLDAFWNADTVNDWNEQYSPRKIIKSPRKLTFRPDSTSPTPSSSPRKLQSPTKRTKDEREAKKCFNDAKQTIAESFLAELDLTITNSQISALAASTGGVRLVWSKSLNSTAGRANWRKETTKARQLDGTSTYAHKHFASIDLADKVIDDEHRLINVLAHEFCHLANFMISGIKDQPHGRQFKVWGKKCTEAFKHRGVEVTTKHSYQIEYKFVWQCVNEECGAEFKRHSKSIDPAKKVCGSCRSKIVQVRPVPRKEGAATNGGGYAAFVKENFAEVKKAMPEKSQKEVMEAVGRKYKEAKEAKAKMSVDGVKDHATEVEKVVKDDLEVVVKALDVITLDD